MRKLPSQMSVAELEDLASKADASTSTSEDPVLLFVSTFDLLPGKQRVLVKALRELYVAWSGETISDHDFGVRLGKFFVVHYKNPPSFVMVNKASSKVLSLVGDYNRPKNDPKLQQAVGAFAGKVKPEDEWCWVESRVLARAFEGSLGKKTPRNKVVALLKLFLDHRETKKGVFFRVNAELKEEMKQYRRRQ